MEQMIAASLAKREGMLILLGLFAGVSLLLASVGIYGVISYSMSRRVLEIGVRMALVARPAQVRNLILRQGMAMALTGVVAGSVASLALARVPSKLLYGVSPSDPVTFVAVVFALAGVALAAIYIPARRAVRIDPVVAIRYE
jgi:putative ABC transport system permease protein